MDAELIRKKLPKWIGKIIEVFLDKDAYCRIGHYELELWLNPRGSQSFLVIANRCAGRLIGFDERRGVLIVNPITYEEEFENALQIPLPLDWIRRIDVFSKPSDSVAV